MDSRFERIEAEEFAGDLRDERIDLDRVDIPAFPVVAFRDRAASEADEEEASGSFEIAACDIDYVDVRRDRIIKSDVSTAVWMAPSMRR